MNYLSASQVSCLQRCDREYLLKYVLKLPDEKTEPLYFGSAFDYLVDNENEIDSFDLQGLRETEYPYRAVLKKMVRSAKDATSHLPTVAINQFKISTSLVKGFIDAVRVDGFTGDWFMSERKTASRIEQDKRLMLHNDIQVATYVANAEVVAKELCLDMKRFRGLTYETTQKPAERVKKSETLEEYAERATVKTEVWTVAESMKAHCTKVHQVTFSAMARKRDDIENTFALCGDMHVIPGNTSQCFRFGSKCQFFNVCHNNQEGEQ